MDQHITWREPPSSGAGGKVAVDVHVVEEPKVAAVLLRELAETLDPAEVVHRHGGCGGIMSPFDDEVTCQVCRKYLAELLRAMSEVLGRITNELKDARAEAAGMKEDLARLTYERLRLVEAIGSKTAAAVDHLRDLRAMTSVGTGECGHPDFPGRSCPHRRDAGGDGRCAAGCARAAEAPP